MFAGKDMTPAVIQEVQKDSPAYMAGIKQNDKIVSINNKKINSILEVSTFISTSTSKNINISVLRNDQELYFSIKPNLIETEDFLGNKIKKRIIGIKISPYNNEFINVKLDPVKALFYSVKEVWFVSVTSLKYLTNRVIGSGDFSQLGGPIKIAQITGQVAELGVIPFLSIMAYISISLGLINLFPIPM